METLIALFSLIGGIIVYLYGTSYAPRWGFFAQLRTGTHLTITTGQGGKRFFVYKNGVAVDEKSNVYADNGEYYAELRSRLSVRLFGMVWKGLPWFNGVESVPVMESVIDFKEDAKTGIVIPSTIKSRRVTWQPPLEMNRAVVMGGLPIENNNLVKIAASFVVVVSNIDDFNYRIASEELSKNTFEAAVRQQVEDEKLDNVRAIRSETFNDDGTEATSGPVFEIRRDTNRSLKAYNYGVQIRDINLPYIEPVGEYAEASRQKGVNEEKKAADQVEVAREVHRENELGEARAKARKKLSDATKDNPWLNLEEGLKGVQPGATVVIGGDTMRNLQINK